MSSFKRAVREKLLLRIGLCGPSGSGKSLTALKLASCIAGGKPFAVIDTERESSTIYVGHEGVGTFDMAPLSAPFSPDRYVNLIREAESYPVIVVDSGTQEWDGEGGVLQLVDLYAKKQSRGGGDGNKFTAWREGDAQHKKFFDAILNCKTHIIVTFRSKQEYAQGVDANGKKTVDKLGMSPITRQGYEYELDVVGDLDTSHTLIFNKTRCNALDGKMFQKPGKDLAAILIQWANTGERAAIKPPAPPVSESPPDAPPPPAQRKETPPPSTQPAAAITDEDIAAHFRPIIDDAERVGDSTEMLRIGGDIAKSGWALKDKTGACPYAATVTAWKDANERMKAAALKATPAPSVQDTEDAHRSVGDA